jgi:hypothetical protein
MEASNGILEYWCSHMEVVAFCVLLFSVLFIIYLPQFVLERRLPKLTLAELTAQCPNLGWTRWGRVVWGLGTSVLAVAGIYYCLGRSHRVANDDASGFLMVAVLCIAPVSAGVWALWTGVYRGFDRRGFTDEYYHIAGSHLSWVPWAQVLAALTIAGVGLAGFFAMGPH